MAKPYDRQRHLAPILPLWPAQIADKSIEGRREIVGILFSVLKRERERGLARHWCYSHTRHDALFACYRAELNELTELTSQKDAA